ncbi:hypothetical protein ACKKBG_A24585 [Auxenochlorella protothecoides x Auxenochlorella symbiontica]
MAGSQDSKDVPTPKKQRKTRANATLKRPGDPHETSSPRAPRYEGSPRVPTTLAPALSVGASNDTGTRKPDLDGEEDAAVVGSATAAFRTLSVQALDGQVADALGAVAAAARDVQPPSPKKRKAGAPQTAGRGSPPPQRALHDLLAEFGRIELNADMLAAIQRTESHAALDGAARHSTHHQSPLTLNRAAFERVVGAARASLAADLARLRARAEGNPAQETLLRTYALRAVARFAEQDWEEEQEGAGDAEPASDGVEGAAPSLEGEGSAAAVAPVRALRRGSRPPPPPPQPPPARADSHASAAARGRGGTEEDETAASADSLAARLSSAALADSVAAPDGEAGRRGSGEVPQASDSVLPAEPASCEPAPRLRSEAPPRDLRTPDPCMPVGPPAAQRPCCSAQNSVGGERARPSWDEGSDGATRGAPDPGSSNDASRVDEASAGRTSAGASSSAGGSSSSSDQQSRAGWGAGGSDPGRTRSDPLVDAPARPRAPTTPSSEAAGALATSPGGSRAGPSHHRVPPRGQPGAGEWYRPPPRVNQVGGKHAASSCSPSVSLGAEVHKRPRKGALGALLAGPSAGGWCGRERSGELLRRSADAAASAGSVRAPGAGAGGDSPAAAGGEGDAAPSSSSEGSLWASSLVCADLTLNDVGSQYWPFRRAGTAAATGGRPGGRDGGRAAGAASAPDADRPARTGGGQQALDPGPAASSLVDGLVAALGAAILAAVEAEVGRAALAPGLRSLVAATAFDDLLREGSTLQSPATSSWDGGAR